MTNYSRITISVRMKFIFTEAETQVKKMCVDIINALEYNGCYRVNCLCEPQLGKRIRMVILYL